MTTTLFGTDGVRGRVGVEPITSDTLTKLAWAAGQVLTTTGGHQNVLIGKDTRQSGEMLEEALTTGFQAAGINVSSLGIIPTPGVAFLTQSLDACAGVVISASHNPYHDNGIKLFSHEGTKLDDALATAIDAAMQGEMMESPQKGQVTDIPDASERYINYCKDTLPESMRLDGLTVVVDCANGAGYEIAPRVLSELGAKVVAIGNTPDGININDNCGSTALAGLKTKVRETGASVGIALDGDGDRVLMVDEQGEEIDGDQILYVLAEHRQREDCLGGGVVGTLMTNFGLEEALAQKDIPFLRTKVGDRYVHEALAREQWLLGGETSGHIICLDKSTTGDGIVGALEVIQVMLHTGKPLSELAAGMQIYPQRIVNVSVDGKDAGTLTNHPEVQSAVDAAQAELETQGRVLLRPSGTEPLIRVMVEGKDPEQVERLAQTIASAVDDAVKTG